MIKIATRCDLRWMIRRDMPDVMAIEAASFDYPWTEADFLTALRQKNCIGMVATADNRIVGYMVYELNKGKLPLLNFAVAPSHRRECIGQQMVRKLVDKLSQHGRRKITLTVRETNLAAQLFFHDHGFTATGVSRGHYEDSGEDGYEMEFRI